MEVIVWIAFAVIVTASGPNIVNSDTFHMTKAECEAENAAAMAAIKKSPDAPKIIAIGINCTEITVKATGNPPVEPKKQKTQPNTDKRLKQSDLERSDNPAQASPFRTT